MQDEVPLVVDLDGTVIKSDMLLETLLAVIRRRPWMVLLVPFWLLRGRAGLKRELSRRAQLAPDELPYRVEVLRWLKEERGRGRHLVLATASDEKVANSIADHLGAFDDVMASNGRRNLKGAAKRAALVERYGERGFDYAGDAVADLEVWSSARRAIVVGNDPGLVAAAGRAAAQTQEIRTSGPTPATLARALRVQQWPKNLLVFVPLVTAHLAGDPAAVGSSLIAFLAFCCAASAIYLVNDLADLKHDRAHERKRARPFASGDLGIGWGMALVPALLAAALGFAALAGWGLTLAVAGYAVAGTLYSVSLKRVAVIDILMIAGFYSARILGGALAIGVVVSDWLFGFSMAIFISLALAKRHAELKRASDLGLDSASRVPGRGYRVGDHRLVGAAGALFALLAVAVLALYITHRDVAILYSHPQILWLAALLLLFWVVRVWLLALRGRLGEDPLSFALRDPASYVAGLLTLLAIFAAT